jgi:ABC-type uncharacterized transport system ATPase component
VRGRLDKQIGQIRGAMQGYSGFFDLVQVDETLLDRVYDLDLGLLGLVDAVANQIEKLSGGAEQPVTVAMHLLGELDELERKWSRREELLKHGQ